MGGPILSLQFISARLEDDLKTIWQVRLTSDTWSAQLPSMKAFATVDQVLKSLSSTKDVWSTPVVGTTTVANVLVAAEMLVQIAEAVGLGTHYWTPERLDASRLMASTDGLLGFNSTRVD